MSMKRMQLILDGHKREVWCERLADKIWYHYRGETFSYAPEIKKRGASTSAGTISHNTVLSPMPGKIIKVLVQQGDSVSEGQETVVMEAMKMEYRLKSQMKGTIAQVMCQMGDQVELGKVLIEIDAEK